MSETNCPLPNAEHAERAVLGALLIDATAYERVAQRLNPDDFYQPVHRLIWEAIAQRHGAVDVIGLGEALRQAGTLDQAGGVAYLEHLADTTVTAAHLEEHAEIVREMAGKRRLIEITYRIASEAHGATSVRELVAEIHQEALALTYYAPAAGRRTSWTAPDLLAAEFPASVWTVKDLLPVGLTFVAGKPKMGKSWLALQLAVAVVSGCPFLGRTVQTGPVWYVALEDSERRMRNRLEAQGIRRDQVSNLVFEFTWDPLDKGGFIRLVNAVAHAKARPRLIVFDTLSRALSGRLDQLDAGCVTEALSRVQRFSLNEELNTVTLDHHKKASGKGDDRDPLSDILGSVAKGAVADAVWSIYRKRGDSNATLWVAGRDLDDTELRIQFDKTTCLWRLIGDAREVARSEAEQEVLDALNYLGGSADIASIARETGKARQSINATIHQLTLQGIIVRETLKTSTGSIKLLYRLKAK